MSTLQGASDREPSLPAQPRAQGVRDLACRAWRGARGAARNVARRSSRADGDSTASCSSEERSRASASIGGCAADWRFSGEPLRTALPRVVPGPEPFFRAGFLLFLGRAAPLTPQAPIIGGGCHRDGDARCLPQSDPRAHRRHQCAHARGARRAAPGCRPEGVASADIVRGDRQGFLSCTRFHPARRFARRAGRRRHLATPGDLPGDRTHPDLPAVPRPAGAAPSARRCARPALRGVPTLHSLKARPCRNSCGGVQNLSSAHRGRSTTFGESARGLLHSHVPVLTGVVALFPAVPIVQRPRTWPFQGQNAGSNPAGDATTGGNSTTPDRNRSSAIAPSKA